jgi:hypothetical protein
MSEPKRVYVAHWFDPEDKILRVAGVYLTQKAADRRIDALGGGCVQCLPLSRAVKFTNEAPRKREQRDEAQNS